MARTTETIIQQMDDAQASEPLLNPLNSPSQSAIYRLWKYITAQVAQYFEQLVDLKKDEINKIVSQNAVPSDAWLKAKVLEFQYDALSPQVIQLVNFVPLYNPVDISKRIISRCSVKTTAARTVTVKVATGATSPGQLSPDQLSSLQAYLTNGGNHENLGAGIGFAGIQINAVSHPADTLYLKANIIFSGQYSATIKDAVKNAIKQYLADISSLEHFDGNIKVLDLIDYIQRVAGVVDIKIEHLGLRADGAGFTDQTYLIQSFTQLLTEYPTFAGYVIDELPPTSGPDHTLTHELTFIAR